MGARKDPDEARVADATKKTRATGATTQRSLGLLVVLLLIGFALALFLRADAQRRESILRTIDERQSAAAVAAEQANSAMVHAWGALAGAAETARLRGLLESDPASIASAAARARPVAGVVVFDAQGRVVAATRDANTAIAAAGRSNAGTAEAWAGVGATPTGARAPVIVRAVGAYRIVSILDPAKLLPENAHGARFVLADADGVALAALPADAARLGDNARSALGGDPAARKNGFIAERNAAAPTAVGIAPVATGDFQILSAASTRSTMAMMLRALLANILLAAAPILAVGAMLLMLRQNQQRVRNAEDEVVRVEERYKLAANGAKAGIFEWSQGSDVILLSEQLTTILRMPLPEITVAQLANLAPAEERPTILQSFDIARETGALDVSFRIPAGHSFTWVEMRGLAFKNPGETTPSIVGTALDVTARREAELRASALQRRLREAIDGFTGPFALWDQRRRLIMWNRSFQQLFNLDAQTLRPGVSYDTVAMASAAHIRRERPDPHDPHIREVQLANGQWLQIQERRTGEGGLLTIGLDITTIKQQEEALTDNETTLKAAVAKLERSEGRNKELARSFEEQKRRAEDASSAKSAFLANMSHELRTPLNAVIGFSEIMSQSLFGPLGDPRYQQYSKDILASGQLLLDLINDILDMAKIEAGKFNLAPRPLDPLDAIEQAVRLVRRRAEDKGLQLLVDAPELPEIEADHRAVKQMLLNLLSNAVKFTAKGGIMVEARASETMLTLRVIDTGRGIPKDHLPRLARPFEQVDNEHSRDHPGTGLGLALTKSLAEMHGGRLEIESQEGKGTVVTIFLPRVFGGGQKEHPPIAAE
ncbi:MAG: PAS domain-containing sensor histidine kinase [Alphaproteobacteria bacterium]|nr:PAS domain-containing sensor histidine kinase [Alphaproteobacteria bacterium]